MAIIIYTCPKCGSDLRDVCITTLPSIHRKECSYCGWFSEETPSMEIIRVPFDQNDNNNYIDFPYLNNSSYINSATYCSNCSNNPKNGGSGVCHCVLGAQQIKY